ncbi:DUF4974 domain-containing protein [Flagellimonas olearia]|uniref:DUF4974 domain-containing protein n=1 Tax=Flagellimonas olearia TaxID=552546 RepID=A0A6I1E1A8_9FLAO|nr:FecR domain-containing protein [Allomuricauda olearia]KAB7530382.1 DUF4974 domain-containing protein [Allomuricauda olearia]
MNRLYYVKDQKIIDYLMGKASAEEQLQMEEWILSSPQNTARFNKLKSGYIASTFDKTSKEIEVNQGYEAFLKAIDKTPIFSYRRLNPVLKYAAVIVFVLGSGYLLTSRLLNERGDFVVPEDAITLQLDNGDIRIVSEDGTSLIVDSEGNLVGKQEGKRLMYDQEEGVDEMVYNTLKVPYGKRFNVGLSDGTIVFLNAGSSLRYPVKFVQGKERRVYLKGEAFFDVIKDPEHPFIVDATGLDVQVLGTKFNVSSYPEDAFVNTVLVEGSVNIFPKNNRNDQRKGSLLHPGQKAQWDRLNGGISIEETDTYLYTAWMKGKIVFKHMPFKHIIKKLERHYNVEIINHNETLGDEFFTASFDVETIEMVFRTFQKNYGLKYSIEDNRIIIN